VGPEFVFFSQCFPVFVLKIVRFDLAKVGKAVEKIFENLKSGVNGLWVFAAEIFERR